MTVWTLALTSVLAPSMSRLVSPCPPSSATSPGSHLRRPSSLPTQTLQLGLHSAAVLQCPHPATYLQSTAARSATAVLLLQHSPAATRALQRLGYSSLQDQGEADTTVTSVASTSTNMPTHQPYTTQWVHCTRFHVPESRQVRSRY